MALTTGVPVRPTGCASTSSIGAAHRRTAFAARRREGRIFVAAKLAGRGGAIAGTLLPPHRCPKAIFVAAKLARGGSNLWNPIDCRPLASRARMAAKFEKHFLCRPWVDRGSFLGYLGVSVGFSRLLNRRSCLRCHSRLIASPRVLYRSAYRRTHSRPRVERAPAPELCSPRRLSKSVVHPT